MAAGRHIGPLGTGCHVPGSFLQCFWLSFCFILIPFYDIDMHRTCSLSHNSKTSSPGLRWVKSWFGQHSFICIYNLLDMFDIIWYTSVRFIQSDKFGFVILQTIWIVRQARVFADSNGLVVECYRPNFLRNLGRHSWTQPDFSGSSLASSRWHQQPRCTPSIPGHGWILCSVASIKFRVLTQVPSFWCFFPAWSCFGPRVSTHPVIVLFSPNHSSVNGFAGMASEWQPAMLAEFKTWYVARFGKPPS